MTPLFPAMPPSDHHGDEGEGHQPQSPSAEAGGEEADGDHGEDVIEPADGMHEAMRETVGVAGSRMG